MKTLEECVANAMDMDDPELLPYLPYILQDFTEIGTSAEVVLDLVRRNFQSGSGLNVLDLGCGKGTVCVKLAEELECRCLGIDAIPGFIAEAGALARRQGVDSRCRFETGDIRVAIDRLGRFDVIVLGAIGPVFGDYFETLSRLEPHMAEGGAIVIDDGHIPEGSDSQHPRVLPRGVAVEQIDRAGMTIVDEVLRDGVGSLSEAYNDELEHIIRRCGELAERHPERRSLFESYVATQRAEYEALETNLTCVTMLISRR